MEQLKESTCNGECSEHIESLRLTIKIMGDQLAELRRKNENR